MILSSPEWHTLTARNRNTCSKISLSDGTAAPAGRPAAAGKQGRSAHGLFLVSGLAVALVLVCGLAVFGFGGAGDEPEPVLVAAAVAEAPAVPAPGPADPAHEAAPAPADAAVQADPGPANSALKAALGPADPAVQTDPGPAPPETTVHQPARAERVETEPIARGGGRWLPMLATAYTPDCGNGDGFTATMTRPRIGVIAVDPLVIPYKTLVYIENYGYFRAEDTGGDIKGDRIDIYMHTREEALQFGRRWVDVKVIGKIEE